MKRLVVLALCSVLAGIPALARADDDETFGLLQQMSYTVSLGGLVPAGQEGEGLDPGYHAGASIHYESGSGLSLGGGMEWNRSLDPLRTHMLTIEGFARISPQDYTLAYLKIGAGAYMVGYDPESPGVPKPANRLRPGGSFGAGVEGFQAGKLGIGASVVYHGVLIQRSDAISFLTASIDLTWRPNAF